MLYLKIEIPTFFFPEILSWNTFCLLGGKRKFTYRKNWKYEMEGQKIEKYEENSKLEDKILEARFDSIFRSKVRGN
jgi:hypothetical protein